MPEAHRDELVLSFYRVRQALGYLGFSLPILLILGGWLSEGTVLPSISDYYHSLQRDIFVGTLCAIAVFLISYKGYRRAPGEVVSDDIISTIAGLAAFGVAFFPNETTPPPEAFVTVTQAILRSNHLAAFGHYGSALVFLSCLAALCLKKFAKSAKPVRRRIYRACGWVIVAMTVGVAVASWFKIRGPAVPQRIVVDGMLVLWFEAIAVWAFSIAWLTKGRADLSLARLVPHRRHPGAKDLAPGQ